MHLNKLFLPLLLAFFCFNCLNLEAEPLKVVTTTGMIADIARNLTGDKGTVKSLMGAGVDPHLYKATHGDLGLLRSADIIFYNGLHLEGKMAEILEQLGRTKTCVPVSQDIPKERLRFPDAFGGHADPHIWFDVSLWIQASETMAKALSAKDPANQSAYEKNLAQYISKLAELHTEVKTEIATIPKAGRVLLTAHDAFGYFGLAYDIEVMGLQGVSTASEFGLYDIARLVDLVIERKIKAIFVESSVPKKFVLALQEGVQAKGHQVAIGGELFSDAMGTEGTLEGTYIGMVKHNVETIVKALK